jgi:hypothetical protein
MCCGPRPAPRTSRPNNVTAAAPSRTDRHRRVVRSVEACCRRFQGFTGRGRLPLVVGVSGHDHREVLDHAHYSVNCGCAVSADDE